METKIEMEVLNDNQGNLIGGGLVRLKPVSVFEGKELIDYLTHGVNSCIDGLKERISEYDGRLLFDTWFHFVRQIEEFINISLELGEPCEEEFKQICLIRLRELRKISTTVDKAFGPDVAARFLDLADLFKGYTF